MKPIGLALGFLLFASPQLSAQTIVIKGVVTDWTNNPLPGVTVQMSRDGRGSAGSWAYVGDTTTEKNGSYRFEIPKGDPLVIYYSRSAYHISEVKRLSGARNAVIGVVLRSASEKLAKNETQEQLLALEGLIAMSTIAPPEVARKTLSDAQANLRSLEAPADLTKQVNGALAALDSTSKPSGPSAASEEREELAVREREDRALEREAREAWAREREEREERARESEEREGWAREEEREERAASRGCYDIYGRRWCILPPHTPLGSVCYCYGIPGSGITGTP